ncbi:YkvA family protein [Schinkia azotoformans]|uniref:YkvA family protein n=1 Tax=Schinkia azotoformans TaxID=1454 RepID=UPI002DB67B29|nr:YkvA family protein [Schinkia azotoformans]MEC1717019.1 YkvA family protein [Schinkia azotoformans]MEC1741323.1 YkvA family protein [Schinkia azotoformans]MEC1747486.1 YkvA family protein [Schinkia azotoformans]MEC1758074.1 YkvA family protein [Schinkia azotoformans]MEC1769173.1 YkvA family protein [Schinkia azotoformans]
MKLFSRHKIDKNTEENSLKKELNKTNADIGKFSIEEVEQQIENASEHFSDKKFWQKLKVFAKKAGSSFVYIVLLLYFTLQKPEVPVKAKATIIGALGYFILPIDLIPDALIGVGYTDDLSAVGLALVQVAIYIDEDIKNKAKAKLQEWFGESVDTSKIDSKID